MICLFRMICLFSLILRRSARMLDTLKRKKAKKNDVFGYFVIVCYFKKNKTSKLVLLMASNFILRWKIIIRQSTQKLQISQKISVSGHVKSERANRVTLSKHLGGWKVEGFLMLLFCFALTHTKRKKERKKESARCPWWLGVKDGKARMRKY